MSGWLLLVFAGLWILTFIPAWMLLLRLFALSVSDRPLGLRFIFIFLLYRLVIALPYLVLLAFGHDLPGIIKGVVDGILILGFVLSAVRFFLKDQAASLLWNLYSYVYDGLLNFYPYTNLLDLVSARVEQHKVSSLLDAGTGTGNLAKELAANNPDIKIIATDPSRKMIDRAERKLSGYQNVEVLNLGIEDYFKAYPETKFDVITLVNVLYALEDRKGFWEQALRHLKSGGRLVVTNSDKGGSRPIIQEHMRHSRFLKLLRPSLIAVFVIDLFISQLAKTGKFHFVSIEKLREEIDAAGGTIQEVERCYGGPKKGVNLLFTVSAKR